MVQNVGQAFEFVVHAGEVFEPMQLAEAVGQAAQAIAAQVNTGEPLEQADGLGEFAQGGIPLFQPGLIFEVFAENLVFLGPDL